jgi:hypothetical protein
MLCQICKITDCPERPSLVHHLVSWPTRRIRRRVIARRHPTKDDFSQKLYVCTQMLCKCTQILRSQRRKRGGGGATPITDFECFTRVRRLFVGISDSTLFVAGESGKIRVFRAIFVDICPKKAGCRHKMGLAGLANVNRRIRNRFSHDQSSHPLYTICLT